MKVQWYHEGEELLEDTNIKIEKSSSHSRLVLTKCRRKTSGEIKIKIKNECGTTQAITQLVVLGTFIFYFCTNVIFIKKIDAVRMWFFVILLSYYR